MKRSSTTPQFPTCLGRSKDIAAEIWQRVGDTEFSYRYVADILEKYGCNLQRLKGNNLILKHGAATQAHKSSLWVFSPRVVSYFRYHLGDIPEEQKEKCRAYNREFYSWYNYKTAETKATARQKLEAMR